MRVFSATAFALLLAAIAWPAEPSIPLSALLDEAAKNNPDILAARRAWQAATQVPSQVSTLPDPQVTLQHFSVGSPRPFAGYSNSDFAYIGLGISQDLPYPGKLKLKGEAAQRDTAIARQKVESVTRTVLQQVKEAYFQLANLQQSVNVLDRDGQLLEQIEKTKLLRQTTQVRAMIDTQQALLRKLLNRAPASPGITPEAMVETPLSSSVDDLLARIRTDNPDVARQQEMINRQSLQVEVARKDRYPDFSVQYMWQHTAEQFRDYYMASFSVRIPIYRSRKLNAEMNQAVEELNRSRREYESQVQSAFFEVRNQYIAAQTASQMLKIYREGLIPQALATYQSGLAAYQTGRLDFQSLLSNFMDVLNFDQEYWKALADHETALAKIEQITGVSFR